MENRLEVLMISSPNREDLVFPKGGWEDDESVEEAACREALEEAGVRGVVKGDRLGVWEFRSKSSQDLSMAEGGCRGFMFALEVTQELDAWPEQGNRARKWLLVKEAFKLCRYEWMRGALEVFLRVMTEQDNNNKTTPSSVEQQEEDDEVASVNGDVCQITISSNNNNKNCHVNPSNVTPFTSSFGIILPVPGIFL